MEGHVLPLVPVRITHCPVSMSASRGTSHLMDVTTDIFNERTGLLLPVWRSSHFFIALERDRELNGEGVWPREILSNGEERNYMGRTHGLGRLRLSVTGDWLKMGEIYLSVKTHLNMVLHCAHWAREILQVPAKPFLWVCPFFPRQQTQGFWRPSELSGFVWYPNSKEVGMVQNCP